MIELLVLVVVLVLVWCLPDSGKGLTTLLKVAAIGILALFVILAVLGHVPGG